MSSLTKYVPVETELKLAEIPLEERALASLESEQSAVVVLIRHLIQEVTELRAQVTQLQSDRNSH